MRGNNEHGYYSTIESKVLKDSRVSDSQLRVMLHLSSFFATNGEFHGSNQYLSDVTLKSERSISRDINKLIEYGYIKAEMIPTKNGRIRILRKGGVDKNGERGVDKNGERGVDKNVYHNNIRENNNIVENEISDPTPLQSFIENNIITLANMGKSVDGKPISLEEAEYIVQATSDYNGYRAFKRNKPSNRNPSLKACSQLVRMKRRGITLEQLGEVTANMFNNDYHIEEKFRHITLEFISRQDKFEKYEEV